MAVVTDHPGQGLVVLIDVEVITHGDERVEEGAHDSAITMAARDGGALDDVEMGDGLVAADGPPGGGHPVEGGAGDVDVGDEVGLGDAVHVDFLSVGLG